MDEILAKASNQAVTFAIRSGISLASGFAIKTVTKLLDKIPLSEKARLQKLKARLQTKVTILSTSIDLIKLSAARGNSVLDDTVNLVSELKLEIDSLDDDLNRILEDLSTSNEKDSVKIAERKIASVLESINDTIPLLNLSLITSGVNLGTSMSPHVSPSRLLQASHHLHTANVQQLDSDDSGITVGPVFDLKLYSVFYNANRLKYINDSDTASSTSAENDPLSDAVTWKEEFARASCSLISCKKETFEYELEIKEDLDDGRYHEDDQEPQVKRYKIKQIAKQFFSASGKLLRLEGSNSPVLTLKIEIGEKTIYLALGEIGDEFDDAESDTDSDSEFESPLADKYKQLSLLEYMLRLASLQEQEQTDILEIKDEKLRLYLADEADQSVIPDSAEERRNKSAKSSARGQMLQEDSAINRLKSLSLADSGSS